LGQEKKMGARKKLGARKKNVLSLYLRGIFLVSEKTKKKYVSARSFQGKFGGGQGKVMRGKSLFRLGSLKILSCRVL